MDDSDSLTTNSSCVCETGDSEAESPCVIAMGGNFTQFLLYILVLQLYTEHEISESAIALYLGEIRNCINGSDSVYYAAKSSIEQKEKKWYIRKLVTRCYVWFQTDVDM
jgi:hypothetical protein